MQKMITNLNELVDYFKNSSKLKEKLKVGIEFEKLGVFADSARAISYEGKEGIGAILSGIAETFKWRALRENDKIIGLSLKDKSITLEPGGQVELSTSPLPDIHELKKEVTEYLRQLKEVSSHFKIKWLGMGIQPLSRVNEIQWVPKERYRIMAPYMKKRGKLAHHMMKKTASIQVNLDFLDEDDFSKKMQAILKLVPFTTAIFANSPVAGGRLTGFLSKRAYIWHHTDPARCGLIEKRFFLSPSFSSYVNYALEVPMLFIIREGRWIKVEGMNFLQFLKKGYEGYRATLDDWELHLSSIFTEVRLRRYIEIRNADSQRAPLVLSVPALWKGILYSKNALEEIFLLLKNISWEKLCNLYLDVPRRGLRTEFEGKKILDFAREILKIACKGLKSQKKLNEKGEDESIYLAPLMELIIERGLSPAEVIVENWQKNWQGSLSKLVEYSSL